MADDIIRITCMVKNRSVDPARKTTLIIAPLALLDQWKLEIEDKSNCGFSCLIYHGRFQLDSLFVLLFTD
jgi:SNF2 family DNA or RNA helicase